MRRVTSLLAAGMILAVCAQAVAQKEYVLERKYEAGDVRTYHVTATGVGSMEIAMKVPEGQQAPPVPPAGDLWVDANLDMSQEVKSVDPQGVAEVVLRFPKMDASFQMFGMSQDITVEEEHVRMSVNGQEVFDSAAAQANPQMGQAFSFFKEGLVMKMDKRGRVVDVPALAAFKNFMPQGFDFKDAMSMSTGDLPDHPVNVGDTWEQVQVLPFKAEGSEKRPQFVTKYKIEGIETVKGRECARVSVNMDAKLDEPVKMTMGPGGMPGGPMAMPGAMDMTLTKLNIAVTGQHYIDLATGAPVDTTLNVKLDEHIGMKMDIPQQAGQEKQQMDMTVKIDGLEVDVDMTLAE